MSEPGQFAAICRGKPAEAVAARSDATGMWQEYHPAAVVVAGAAVADVTDADAGDGLDAILGSGEEAGGAGFDLFGGAGAHVVFSWLS